MNFESIETPTGSVLQTQTIRGTVISVATRQEFTTKRDPDMHHHTGKITPGQVYNEASTVRDIWLKTEDGSEMKLPYSGLGLALREGHAIAFVQAKDHHGAPWCLGAKNFTTGEIKVSEKNTVGIAGDEASKPPKLPFGAAVQVPVLLIVSLIGAFIEGNGGFAMRGFIIVAFWALIAMMVVSVMRQQARNKRAGCEAAATLRSRLDRLSPT